MEISSPMVGLPSSRRGSLEGVARRRIKVSTPWTPALSPASSDMDANFSELHALQSPEFREQASSPIGELSPTPRLREVGVAERRPVRTSRDVTSGRSSRPRHRQVLYFPHRHLWTMEYSCKVWCKPCRRRLIPRQHSRLSWRLSCRQPYSILSTDQAPQTPVFAFCLVLSTDSNLSVDS
ncbi:hypothetical protein Taro_049006 [Colocasia esculenta]|uniref:Uncharacterized protein n=1 Tax=Colocasia esculenta TaxID=4460 RepID=A0A843X9S0_COLES|nr:hypothetical protein [Colocasia esculenta]